MKNNIHLLSIILIFSIIISSCKNTYKECEFTESDMLKALYNDVLIDIVEHHSFHRYLGKEVDILNDRVFKNQIDSTDYVQQLISLQNELHGETEKFHTIYIVDTLNEKVDKLFGLHNIWKFKMENYVNIETDTIYKKISSSPKLLFDSINYIHHNFKIDQFHTCTFNVKSINSFNTNDFNNEIGILLFSKVSLNKNMNEGVFYYIFRCGDQCAKGSLCHIKKIGNHWQIVRDRVLWVS
jgi:hypothetical protein